jgi:hypothetical protein
MGLIGDRPTLQVLTCLIFEMRFVKVYASRFTLALFRHDVASPLWLSLVRQVLWAFLANTNALFILTICIRLPTRGNELLGVYYFSG